MAPAWLRFFKIVAVAVFLLAAGRSAQAAPKVESEYDIKAVFVLNFTRFIEWPAANKTTEALVIGILGEDSFDGRLEQAVRGERVGERPLTVKHVLSVEDATSCDVLFISRSEKAQLGNILDRLKSRPILTVSDMPDFAESGGMVGLVTEKSKIKLRINIDASKAANLAISAKLLRPASIVSSRKTSHRDPFDCRGGNGLYVSNGTVSAVARGSGATNSVLPN